MLRRIVFQIMIASLFLGALLSSVNRSTSEGERVIKIIDAVTGSNSIIIGNETEPLPPGGYTFTVNVTLEGETNYLRTYQIAAKFNKTKVICSNAWIPKTDPNFVFYGRPMVQGEPLIDEDLGYVCLGASLIGKDYVNVSQGIFCQMSFSAIDIGISQFEIIPTWSPDYPDDTFLWDNKLYNIPFTSESLQVTVLGTGVSPLASFMFGPSTPAVNEAVVFDASSSRDPDGYITTYSWNFGDGNTITVTEPTVTHVYAKSGYHTVNLTVTDNEGFYSSALKDIPIGALSTIYIKADGSINPLAAPIHRDEEVYTLTDNILSVSDGIVVERDNVVLDGAGYVIQAVGPVRPVGILLAERSNVTIQNARVTQFDYGIRISNSSDIILCSNEATDEDGINCLDSNNLLITDNNVSQCQFGISLVNSNNTLIHQNTCIDNLCGIDLAGTTNNTVTKNTCLDNFCGIELTGTTNNTINGNNFSLGELGIELTMCDSDRIFHNNFINNKGQVIFGLGLVPPYISRNVLWDNGYPSGGNYWSDYTGVDLQSGPYQNETRSDGISDTPYTIDANNTDRYPLTGTIDVFDVGTWNGSPHEVHVISNSTVSSFQLNVTQKAISFNVTGELGSGFCRATIPNLIVEELWQGNYIILINEQPVDFQSWTDNANTYIYFTYQHSEHKIIIIPEFPSALILLLLISISSIAVILAKKISGKTKEPSNTQFSSFFKMGKPSS